MVALLLMALPCAAEEPVAPLVKICPLDQIWALDMPGTRDIREIVKVDTTRVPPRPSQLDLLTRALLHKTSSERFPGYAVPGRPNHGFRWAARALRGREPFGPIPAAEDTQLLFFSHVSSYRAELLSVRRDGFDIKIEYRFAPQYSSEARVSFALIPLGKLPAGEYHVAIQQAPMEQKHLDAGFEPVEEEQASHMVCGPFSFEVYEPPVPDPGPNKNAVLIPLDEIWALDMPGTRDAKELDGSLVREIGDSTLCNLETGVVIGLKTRTAFAVLGTGVDALRAAHAVFTDKNKPRKTFPEESNVSVVFYSIQVRNRYVHLDRVERQGEVIHIHYRFVLHKTKESTRHLALIPLGKLPSGKYRVKMIKEPMKPKYTDQGPQPITYEDSLRYVGNSFTFFVGEQPVADQELNEAGGEIYLDEIWASNMPETLSIGKLNGGLAWEMTVAVGFPSEGKNLGNGFATRGTGREALRSAYSVLTEKNKPRETFPQGSSIFAVFFTTEVTAYVHLHHVERKGNVINIRYRFVPHETEDTSRHVALIPLGKLPPGEYRVNVSQASIEQAYVKGFWPMSNEEGARRIVCNSFSFLVLEKGE